MKNWKYKVDIKQHLTDDESWEGIATAANNIAKELRKLPERLFEDYRLEDDVEFLEGVCIEDCEVYDYEQNLLDEVNYRLNSIYDFADAVGIWLG